MSPLLRRPLMRETLQPAAGPEDPPRSQRPITFRVLGSIEVETPNGRTIPLSGPAQKALLGFLLLHPNRPVAHSEVAEALWGVDAGYTTKRLQMAVTRLRKSLKPLQGDADETILRTIAGGYQLVVAPGALDADVFEERLRQGRAALEAGDPARAGTIFRAADALWNGPALSDLALAAFAQDEIRRLEDLRLSGLEARIEADLAGGRHADVLAELERLVAAHPTRDRLAAHLMLTLYRSGRPVEALDVYRVAGARLRAELGLEPGPELQRMQARILNHDATLLPGAAPLPLELDAAGPLHGREREYAQLCEHWQHAQAGTLTVVALVGPQGIGKTRLAAELAEFVHEAGAPVHYVVGRAAQQTVTDALASTGPALLVTEDVDPATLALLRTAKRDVPVLTLCLSRGALLDAEPWWNSITLDPLGPDAVAAIVQAYAPGDHGRGPDISGAGAIPGRVHAEARQWARRESARRIGAAATRTAAGRAELQSMETELADEVEVLREVASHTSGLRSPVVCPFKGLAAFDVDDARYYYGRERLTAELVARLAGAPLLGVIGPSGSGKSSVVRAGLVPALAEGVLPGSERWRPTIIRPGAHPPQDLASLTGEGRFVLVVDQFEEIFTACEDPPARRAFIDEIVRLAGSGRGVVVLALRADQYGRCADHPGLSRLLAANQVLVLPMTRDEVRRAIECPAERAGLSVDDGLTDQLMADVERQPGGLPLLSTALLELWQRRDGRRLRLSVYEETGGVRAAVARLAENAFCQLDPDSRPLARDVLTRLVTESAQDRVERRRIALAELEETPELARVASQLADARLLTVGDGAIELAHESLLREWPRLRRWIEDDREDLRIRRALTLAAREWVRLGRTSDNLYRGTVLAIAREWRARRQPVLSEAERSFLEAGAVQEDRERIARRRRLRAAGAGIGAVLVAVVAAAVVIVQQNHEGSRGTSRDLANQSALVLPYDPSLALGVALWAREEWDTGEARAAVRQATLGARATMVRKAAKGWLYAAAPSEDGREVLTADADGAAQIWDLATGKPAVTFSGGKDDGAGDIAMSPRGGLVATAGSDGRVVVRDRGGGDARTVLEVPDAQPMTVQFASDSRRLVVAMTDGSIHVVDARSGESETVLKGHSDVVYGARFDPTGTRVVSASADRTARIWDLATRTATVLDHPDGVGGADFSADGAVVATAGDDGVIRVWDAASGRRQVTFRAGKNALLSIRFSPTGRKLLTASSDGIVRLSDAGGGPALAEFTGHRGRVLQANFVPGSDALVSAGEDGTLRVWQPNPSRTVRATLSQVILLRRGTLAVGGSVDGRVTLADLDAGTSRELAKFEQSTVVAASQDGSLVVGAVVGEGEDVHLWQPDTGGTRLIPTLESTKYSIALDPTGRWLAFGEGDGTITLQRLDGTGRRAFKGHRDTIWDVNFNADGTRLISASEDGTVRVWNVATGRAEHVLNGHGDAVNAAVFSSTADEVASAGADATIRVWNLASGRSRVLHGHVGAVNSVQFEPRGRRLVSAGQDGTVRVWDASRTEPSLVLFTHADGASAAAFSPDGSAVVSAGDDGYVRWTRCETCGPLDAVVGLARTRADRDVSPLDRRRFLTEDG